MRTLVLATGNANKIAEMQDCFHGWQILPKPADLEIEETGSTFNANAHLKALGVAQATGHLALGEDSGLEIRALGGQPGVLSARWGQSDSERIGRVLRELEGITDRQAQFVSTIVIASPSAILYEVSGICVGELLTTPRGTGGFGYDPIFYYPPLALTLAEMSRAQKQQISHRGQSLQKLRPWLETYS
jgi:XTP/dITP diphosphohydrolase